jgi:Peptidyl-prolyl cis-trans isomerase (rotamase) - cyclophilin family
VRRISLFVVILVAGALLAAIWQTQYGRVHAQGSKEPLAAGKEVPLPMVTIEMESGNKIVIELYPDIAPNTVRNFIHLARSGFYDGTIFHRVVPGFVIQGGDPLGTGTGGPGYSIRGEFAANGFPNDLKHTRGVVSMARTQDPNSAGSQFFIMVADAPHLDGHYAAFGRVVEGMEEVDRIVAVPRDMRDRPLVPQRIVKVTVDTGGVEYPEPEKYTRR